MLSNAFTIMQIVSEECKKKNQITGKTELFLLPVILPS